MKDLFEREQQIYNTANERAAEMQDGGACSADEFTCLVKEYGRLLRHLRRVTKLSDGITVNLNASKRDLLRKVHYDALTGIYNRRYAEENLKRVIKSLSRSGSMLSVLMIDVDFFKKYNDTYGHGMGDECLKAIAATFKAGIARTDDFVARYGGEEFVVILPNTDGKDACMIANKLLKNVRACDIKHEESNAADHVTISIGVTSGKVEHTRSGTDYIKKADEALYMSKNNGRDRYSFIEL